MTYILFRAVFISQMFYNCNRQEKKNDCSSLLPIVTSKNLIPIFVLSNTNEQRTLCNILEYRILYDKTFSMGAIFMGPTMCKFLFFFFLLLLEVICSYYRRGLSCREKKNWLNAIVLNFCRLIPICYLLRIFY